MKLYAFRDISISSPDQHHLPVSVDIELGLRNIGFTRFSTDFGFHDALSNLFNKLRDAHTRYSKPECYANFVFRLSPSVTLSSIMLNGTQSIVMNDPSGDFDGQVVATIDGVDAFTAVQNWASEYGRDSLDLGTRFNQALKAFTTRPLATYNFPQDESMTFTFQQSRATIFLPWVAYSQRNVSSITSLHRLCKPQTTEIRNGSIPYIDYLDNGLHFDSHEERLQHHRTALQQHIEEMHSSLKKEQQQQQQPSSKSKSSTSSKTTHSSTHISHATHGSSGQVVYQTKNIIFSIVKPGVGALKIPSFFPSEFGLDTIYSIKSIPEFLFDIQRVYVLAFEMNVNDLIIDLRGNGGGWVCLAMEFLRILFPGTNGSQPAGELFDMISSPLLLELATKAAQLPRDVYSIFSPWKFLDPTTLQPYTTTSWLTPGFTYVRGGQTGFYSNMVTDDCSMVDIPQWNPKYLFSPSNVLILTDGTCGSACALVARNIQERMQARTMVVGGIQGRSQMIASFIGGLVYDLPTLLEEVKLLGLTNSPNAPKPLPTSANLRFTLWEQYPWVNRAQPPIPAEFVFEASDYRLMYTRSSVNDNNQLYTDAYNMWKSG